MTTDQEKVATNVEYQCQFTFYSYPEKKDPYHTVYSTYYSVSTISKKVIASKRITLHSGQSAILQTN